MNHNPNKQNSRATATQDDRLVRSADPAVRGDRGVAEDAARTIETGLLSQDELEKLIANEFEQTALPTAPLIPGWHVVWLTTASQYDSIQKRERLGYVPVRRDEVPGFDPSNGQAVSRFEGCVTCNEMVLFKIPEERYQAIMRYFHHKKPLEEEASIVESIKAQARQRDSSGRPLGTTEGDGINDLETGVEYAQRQTPVFS